MTLALRITEAEEARPNLSLKEAMEATAVDPVAAAHFACSRQYGELLEASLTRTDAMLAPCDCGTVKAFCRCVVLDRSHLSADPDDAIHAVEAASREMKS